MIKDIIIMKTKAKVFYTDGRIEEYKLQKEAPAEELWLQSM